MGVRAGIFICVTSFLLGIAVPFHHYMILIVIRYSVHALDCGFTYFVEVPRNRRAYMDCGFVLLYHCQRAVLDPLRPRCNSHPWSYYDTMES